MTSRIAWTSTAAAALTLGLSAAAQTPPTTGQPDRPPDGQSGNRLGQHTVTVTGCLERVDWTASSSGAGTAPTGQAGVRAAPEATPYILTNAAATTTSTEPAPTDTTESKSAPKTALTYGLTGGDQKELERLVGKRVRVRGWLELPKAPPTSLQPEPESLPTRPGADAMPPTLIRVSSVSAVSGKCE
jgi:hypothetical protein